MTDEDYRINTTSLYNILAQGRTIAQASVYGGNIDKVIGLNIRIFTYFINFDKRLWTVRSFYHSRYDNREKQVDTSITGREISGLSVIIMDIRS